MDVLDYEQLFDILREERNNVSLQTLSDTFFEQASEYLKIKSDGGADQLKNAKRIVEEIYQRREKKILNLALSKSRTKSNLIDTSALLPEERLFFKQTVILLDHFREDLLQQVLQSAFKSTEGPKDIPVAEDSSSLETSRSSNSESDSANSVGVSESGPSKQVRVKFLGYVDKFVGPDLSILGPFEEGDVAELPESAAHIVISKELAEIFGE